MSVNASYAPQESAHEIWEEVTYFIGETVLGGFTLGILATLYVLCLDSIIPQLKKPSRRKWAAFHILYTTTIVGLVTTGSSSNFRFAQVLWIDNRNYPGGPYQFLLNVHSNIETWGWAAFVVASWFQDTYVLYRCLVFWDYNWWVCGLPCVAFVGSLGTSIALLVETANPSQYLAGKLTIDFAICWYIFSVSVNVLSTIAILSRLLWKRKTITALLGKEHSRVYTGIVAMLIESAAIYSILGIIFIGNYFRQNAFGNLVLPALGNVEGICPLMIIYRVANGRGWTTPAIKNFNSTINGGPMSTLRFNHPSTTMNEEAGQTRGFGTTDAIDGGSKSMVGSEGELKGKAADDVARLDVVVKV